MSLITDIVTHLVKRVHLTYVILCGVGRYAAIDDHVKNSDEVVGVLFSVHPLDTFKEELNIVQSSHHNHD